MSVTWAKHIHTPEFLYYHRLWRFRDSMRQAFVQAFDLIPNSSVIEIGCGPGALCQRIKEWFPSIEVTGFDNDVAFINFASSHVHDCLFKVDDVSNAFEPQCDYVFSHTIMEYMSPNIFFNCIKRLLKKNGTTIIMSSVPVSRQNPLMWNPNILEIDNIISQFGCQPKTDNLITRQGYNDISIVKQLHDYGLRVNSIVYIPIITNVCMLSSKEKLQYQNVLEKYQKNRIITSCGDKIPKDDSLSAISTIIRQYYDQAFKQINNILPFDIDVIRIIKAKNDECT